MVLVTALGDNLFSRRAMHPARCLYLRLLPIQSLSKDKCTPSLIPISLYTNTLLSPFLCLRPSHFHFTLSYPFSYRHLRSSHITSNLSPAANTLRIPNPFLLRPTLFTRHNVVIMLKEQGQWHIAFTLPLHGESAFDCRFATRYVTALVFCWSKPDFAHLIAVEAVEK